MQYSVQIYISNPINIRIPKVHPKNYLCILFPKSDIFMRKILTASFLAITILLVSYHCVSTDSSYSRVAPGMWRGVLELEKFQMAAGGKDSVVILYDQFKPGELPFNFEIKYVDETHFYLEIMNGSERIRLDSVQYGRDRTQARDTMNVWFPEYQCT